MYKIYSMFVSFCFSSWYHTVSLTLRGHLENIYLLFWAKKNRNALVQNHVTTGVTTINVSLIESEMQKKKEMFR